jgi:uncharacterized RDD family membrane protein YckC
MNDESSSPSPSLLRRLAALLYDILLVVPLVMLSVALFMGARTLLLGPPAENTVVQLDANLVRLVAFATVATFFCGFWLKSGQTLGMQAWRIKLVSTDGGQPSAGQAILRCFGALVSAAAFGLGYLWCLVDRNDRYWHDYLSRTRLIMVPKRNRDVKKSSGKKN